MAAPWSHRFAGTERVVVGAGSVVALPEECDARGMTRVVVVTGRTLHERTDVVSRVESLLGPRHVATYARVREHVPGRAVEQLTALLQRTGADRAAAARRGRPLHGT